MGRAGALEFSRLSLDVPGWDDRAVPLNVGVLSDIHLGSHTDDAARFEEAIDLINAQAPDIVLLVGDFMNTQFFGGGRIPPETIAKQTAKIDSRLGLYAVLGNHDWHYGGSDVTQALEAQGIIVLENEARIIRDEDGDFSLIGLADHQTRKPDFLRATKNLAMDMPGLVMAHDPATFAQVSAGPMLTLSGHTHGGQVCLPFFGPITNSSSAPMRWTAGHVVEDERHLFVCRGFGTSILPFRWNCPPEICMIRLGGGDAP